MNNSFRFSGTGFLIGILVLAILFLSSGRAYALEQAPPEDPEKPAEPEKKPEVKKPKLEKLPEGVIARIDGEDVKAGDFSKFSIEFAGSLLITNFIDMYLLEKEARRRKVEIDEAELKKQIDEVIDRQKQGARDEKGYQDFLDKQYFLTEEKFRIFLNSRIRMNLLKEKLVQAWMLDPEQCGSELERRFKRQFRTDKEYFRVSHILIKPKKGKPAKEVEDLAFELAAEIKTKTTTFEDAAKKHSEDQYKDKGGDMGFRLVESLKNQPEFMESLNSLKAGEVSRPFETKQGWHIIKLVARYPAGKITLKDVEEYLKEGIASVRPHRGMQNQFMDKLRGTADIKIDLK